MPDESLFKFLSLKQEAESKAFSLATVLAAGSMQDYFTRLEELIQVQTKALNELFFEKLRGNAAVNMVKQRLPPSLRVKDFDVDTHWPLDTHASP